MGYWLTSKEIDGTAFSPAGAQDSPFIPLGKLVDGRNVTTDLNFYGRAHLFCLAPSGAGKSQALAIPTLRTWESSAIILDVKGELYAESADHRKTAFGHTVHRFDPSDPNGAKFNPMAAINRNDEAALEQDVTDTAGVMVPIAPDMKEPFFRQSARQIIETGLHALLFAYRDQPEAPPLSDLVDACYDPVRFKTAAETLTTLAAKAHVPDSASLLASAVISQFFDQDGNLTKTGQSVWAELGTHLAPLNTSQVRRATSETSWKPEELRDGKTSIYFTLSPSAKGQYRSVLALVLNAHLSKLMSALPKPSEPPVLLLLDEMPQLGHMKAIEQVIDLGRGYNLLLFGLAQRKQQIEASYGNANDFLGTFQARLYMNPSPEDGSATMLSKAIGEKLVGGEAQKLVPVAPENELCGHEYRDDIIVLSRASSPARVRKQFAFQRNQQSDAPAAPSSPDEGAPSGAKKDQRKKRGLLKR